MILETPNLILRHWKESDSKDLFELAKDPLIGPACGWLPHSDAENSLQVIKDILSPNEESYSIILKRTSKLVGSIAFEIGKESNLNIPQDEAELGFWIGVPYWGQGLIPEAVKVLIKHGFEDLKLKVIWCVYFDGNERSKRVQEKCGFTHHHTIKNIYWDTIKEYKTEHVNRLTKEEFYTKPVI